MTTEKLTDEERSALDSGMCHGGMEALRIIDAHAADRAALVAQVAELTRELDEAQESAVNNSRCLEQSIQREEVTEQALQASQANAGVWFDRAHAAESALEAAQAERDDKAIAFDLAAARADAAEAQVAELTRERDEARGRKPFSFQIRFDGPPGPESGRFIECETLDGKGVSVGRWEQDGEYWLLVVEGYDAPARLESEVARLAEALVESQVNGARESIARKAAEARVRELEAEVLDLNFELSRYDV